MRGTRCKVASPPCNFNFLFFTSTGGRAWVCIPEAMEMVRGTFARDPTWASLFCADPAARLRRSVSVSTRDFIVSSSPGSNAVIICMCPGNRKTERIESVYPVCSSWKVSNDCNQINVDLEWVDLHETSWAHHNSFKILKNKLDLVRTWTRISEWTNWHMNWWTKWWTN